MLAVALLHTYICDLGGGFRVGVRPASALHVNSFECVMHVRVAERYVANAAAVDR